MTTKHTKYSRMNLGRKKASVSAQTRAVKAKPKQQQATLKVILVGEGGQGIQTIAKILTHAAFEFGYHTSYLPNFGTEQRGGLSIAFLQLSQTTIISPKFKHADLFAIVSNRDIKRITQYIGSATHVLYDTDLLEPAAARTFSALSRNVVPITAFRHATTSFSERSFNVILLGILTGLIDHNLAPTVLKEMNSKFAKYYEKTPELKTTNEHAFNLGLSMTHHE